MCHRHTKREATPFPNGIVQKVFVTWWIVHVAGIEAAFVFFPPGVDKKAGETFIVTKRIASHEKYHLIFIENYLRRTLIGSWTSLKEVYLYSSVVEQGQNEAYTMFTVFLPQTFQILCSSDEIEWKISMDPILAKREKELLFGCHLVFFTRFLSIVLWPSTFISSFSPKPTEKLLSGEVECIKWYEI